MLVPKPRKLKSGNWFIQLRLGGESVPITESTERQCIKTAQYVKAEYLAGKRRKRKGGDMTLREAIGEYIDVRKNILSPTTIRLYKQIQSHRFKDIMDKPLKSINDWQRLCNNEARVCAPKTLKGAWNFVASVIAETTKQTPPKVKLPQIIPKEIEFLEPEQIPLFIKMVENEKCELPALLALHGLRRSEIFALTWDNFDIKNNVIKVRGAVVYNEENKLVRKATNKTTSSRRDVPILIPRLRQIIMESTEKKGPVVERPGAVYNQINRLCKSHDLPQVGIHGLRHSFASLAYHLGISEMVVMKIGGWNDYATMRRIYTHLANRDILKAESALTDFFQNANNKTN